MHHVYLVPSWFLGFDVLFELLFAVVALIVGIFAFKVHRLSSQRQPRLFGISFLFISASYFVQAIMNLFIIFGYNEQLSVAIGLPGPGLLNFIGVFTHMVLFTIGLVALVYMTLDFKSPKAFALLLALIVLPLVLDDDRMSLFYILSSGLLSFVLLHYIVNFWRNRQLQTLLVLVAFAFLLVGSIHFVLAVNHAVFYVIGHFLGLIGYMLILLNLIIIMKHEQKAG